MAAGGCATVPLFAPRWLARRAERRRVEAVPAVLDSVARSLRSGASLTQALGEAAAEETPLAGDLALVVAEAERGAGVEAALQSWAERREAGPIRLAAAALGMGAEFGGATARTVEGIAATVRQRLAVAGEAKALTSQARISAQVIALAPLAFCAIGAATDPALAAFLFVTPLGWCFLVVGVTLDLVGAAWMRRLAAP
jgi:tight adherence protein B